LADDSEDGRCFRFRFAPGHAEDAVAGGDQFSPAPVVAVEGDLDSVVLAAVGFDHEAGVLPEKIDLEDSLRSLDWGVEAREGKACGGDERQELDLEEAAEGGELRGLGDRSPVRDDAAQARSPTSFRPVREDRVDPGDVQDPLRRRPLDRLPHLLLPIGPRQVHDRPRHPRDRDPPDVSPFMPGGIGNPVRLDPVDLASPLRGRD
jgi:hypothetical protein